MDAFESFHPVPAAWLRDSDLAPFIPAYAKLREFLSKANHFQNS